MINNDSHISPANPKVNTPVQYEYDVGNAYGPEHIQNVGCVCNSSASHTYGNVMAIVEQFLVDKFPPDVFMTKTVSTTLASRQLRHVPSKLTKLDYPMLVLAPRIVFGQGEDRFLGHTLLNDNFYNLHMQWGDGSLIPLGMDRNKHIFINGKFNRALVYIDIVLAFDTYAEQMNWMSYIHNMLNIGHPKDIKAPMEIYIPPQFCELISKLSGVPVMDSVGSTYKFTKYMNSLWTHPITYKLKGGSNSFEYFMYYVPDINLTIQEPSYGEGMKDNQIKRAYDITFTVRCEFNTIGYYTLTCPQLQRNIDISNYQETSTRHVETIMTDYVNLNDFDMPLGWKVLSWPIFKVKKGTNSINIDEVLNESLRVMIDYHLNMGMSVDKFINVQFRDHGSIINEDFYIDWPKRKLVLIHPDWHKTYKMLITVNPEYINTTIKELYNLE